MLNDIIKTCKKDFIQGEISGIGINVMEFSTGEDRLGLILMPKA